MLKKTKRWVKRGRHLDGTQGDTIKRISIWNLQEVGVASEGEGNSQESVVLSKGGKERKGTKQGGVKKKRRDKSYPK